MGGCVLGMPYVYYHMGIPLALVSSIIMGFIAYFSAIMLLKTKDLTPRRYESIYEIAFLLMGRPALFVVNIVVFLATFGPLILYYIVFGDVLSEFAK